MAATKTDGVADAETFVVMLASTGRDAELQWFDYRPQYFGGVVRVAWPSTTMFATLPSDVAHFLLQHGYARAMTEQEVEDYTAPKPKGDKS